MKGRSRRSQQWARIVLPDRASGVTLSPSSEGSAGGLKASKVNLHQRTSRGQLSLHVSLKPFGFTGGALREAGAALVVLAGKRPSRAVARTGRAQLGIREGRVCGVFVNLRGRERERVRAHLQRGARERAGSRRALQRDDWGGWRLQIPRSVIPELDRWFKYFPNRSKGRLEVVYRPRSAGWPGRKAPRSVHQRVTGQGVRAAERRWLACGSLGRPRQ